MSSESVEVQQHPLSPSVQLRKKPFSSQDKSHLERIGIAMEILVQRLRNLQEHDEHMIKMALLSLAAWTIPILPTSISMGFAGRLGWCLGKREKLYEDYVFARTEALLIYDWVLSDVSQHSEIMKLEPFKNLVMSLAEITAPGRIIKLEDFVPEPTLLGKFGNTLYSFIGYGASGNPGLTENKAVKPEGGSFPLAKQIFQYNPDLPSPIYQKATSWVSSGIAKYGTELSKLPSVLFAMIPTQSEVHSVKSEKPKFS